MTVVYCDWGDDDTKVLKNMWKGFNANVITLTANSSNEALDKLDQIYEEEDTLILTGHGGPNGLWAPGGGKFLYGGCAFSKYDVPYLKCKNLIGIWCNASSFSQRYEVPGFFSSMFISNTGEESYCGVRGVSQEDITRCEIEFCNKVNQLLKDNVPLEQWVDNIKGSLLNENSNDVEKFNYNGLYYYDGR